MKKVSGLLLVAACLLSCNKLNDYFLYPHTSPLQFSNVYGGSDEDRGYAVTSTRDGGYVMAGYTASNDGDVTGNHGGGDAWIVKVNKGGLIEWQKALGGSGWDQVGHIITAADGGYLASGFTSSNDGDVSGNHQSFDAWVIRLTSEGKILWQKSLGGSDQDYASEIIKTMDGGCVMVGQTGSSDGDVNTKTNYVNAWVVKLDKNGHIEWQRTLSGPDETRNTANAITYSADGGYVVAGSTTSATGEPSEYDSWIAKLDKNGNVLWQKAVGDVLMNIPNSITTNVYGEYVIAGITNAVSIEESQYDDVWLVKLDTSGNVIWQKTLGRSGYDDAKSIISCSDGGYVIAGAKEDTGNSNILSNALVVKLNENGNIVWQKTFGGSGEDLGLSIVPRREDGYLMAGFTNSNDGDIKGNHGSNDAWLITIKDL